MAFAFAFGAEIGKGATPAEALRNACTVFPSEMTDGVDAKTLRRWIKESFGATVTPRDNVEWLAAIRSWYQRVLGPG